MNKTEIKQEVLLLGTLLDELARGKIRIPRYQRPFVWTQDDMLRLLDSVARGYPIGNITLYETRRQTSSRDHVGPLSIGPAPEGPVRFIIDGEQRLTTLAGCLMLGDDDAEHAERVDWMISYDLRAGVFLTDRVAGTEPFNFPVRSLLSTARFLEAASAIMNSGLEDRRGLVSAAEELTNAFRNYQVPVTTVLHAEFDTSIEIFTRLNLGGRQLSMDQMVSALTYTEGSFDLSASLDRVQERLASRGFGGVDRTIVLRTFLAALGLDIVDTHWERVVEESRPRLSEAIDAASTGLLAAIEVLGQLGVTSYSLLPYGTQLMFLAEAFRLDPSPSESVRALLERWFWVTSFTPQLRGLSGFRSRRVLDELRELVRTERDDLESIDLEAPADPFPERLDTRSARVRAFLAYLVSLKPRSLLEPDELLQPARLLSLLGARALSHVVGRRGDPGLHYSPANRLFVDEGFTGNVLDVLVRAAERRDLELLASHGFASDAVETIIAGDHAGLLEGRRRTLIEGEREFMQRRGVTLPQTESADVLADSDTDEGQRVFE